MKRREFLLAATALAAEPARTFAQSRVFKVGFLHPAQASLLGARIDAIKEGVLGGDSQSAEILVRSSAGDHTRLPILANDLAALPVDIIIAAARPAVLAARSAARTIPLVAIDLETDPVASGWVASLARPGGNVSGLFLDFPDFSAKCLQLLIESIPALTEIGVLWDPSTGELPLQAVESAAKEFAVGLHITKVENVEQLEKAFATFGKVRLKGALLLSSPLFGGNPGLVAKLGLAYDVPTISLFPDIAKEGGLLAYGPDLQSLYRQAGVMARKVLQGSRIADLPAERPTRFALVANLRTAKHFGISLPTSILLRADEVIE